MHGWMETSRKLISSALLSQAPSFQMLSVDSTTITVLESFLVILMRHIRICILLGFFPLATQNTVISKKHASVLRSVLLKKESKHL